MAASENRMSRLEKPFVQIDVADLMFPVPGKREILENEPGITQLCLGEPL